MSTKRQGFVALRAGDRALTLRFSNNAMCLYEELSGGPFTDVLKLFEGAKTGTLHFSAIRNLLVAGLSDTLEVTPREAGEIIDEAGLELTVEKIGEAIEAALPVRKETPAGNAGADKG